MSSQLVPVLTSRDLPLAELSGARIDGEVFALGEAWCPIDEIESPASRARVAGLLVPARAIAERMSAAWIYGFAPEPLRHQFCVDIGARAHIPLSPRLQLREVICSPEDNRTIGGLRVTTPLRTFVDLALCTPDDPVGLVPLLAELLGSGSFGQEQASRLLCRPHLPNKTRALHRLDAALALLVGLGG